MGRRVKNSPKGGEKSESAYDGKGAERVEKPQEDRYGPPGEREYEKEEKEFTEVSQVVTKGTSKADQMVITIARMLRDGECALVTEDAMLPMMSCRMAQFTHAPNLTMVAAASNTINTVREPFEISSSDMRYLRAEAMMRTSDIVHAASRIDVFIVKAMQVDGLGNISTVPPGENPFVRMFHRNAEEHTHHHEEERGVGEWNEGGHRPQVSNLGEGAAWATFAGIAKRTIIFTESHNRETLVKDLLYTVGPGISDERARNTGPVAIITPLCVIEFVDGSPFLRSVNVGASADDVVKNTGFEMRVPEKVEETPQPTRDEKVLLYRLDPDGLVRNLFI